jgi:hypothetical protein
MNAQHSKCSSHHLFIYGVHIAFCLMDNGGYFLGIKRPEHDAIHSSLSSVEFRNKWRCAAAYTYDCMMWTETYYLYLFIIYLFMVYSKNMSGNSTDMWADNLHLPTLLPDLVKRYADGFVK